MFVEKEGVEADSPAAQEEVKEAVINESAETVEQQETPEAEAGKIEQDDSRDEQGVPYKNRYMEYKRKVEDLSSNLPNIIEQKLKEVIPTLQPQQAKPQYTIADLESFAIQNPDQRPWVEQEKAKLIQLQLAEQVDQKFKQAETQRENQYKRQQSEAYVAQNYPELFVKDGQGRVLGWDQSNPLTYEVSRLMADPDLAKRADGLQIAADIAYARYVKAQGLKTQKTTKALKGQVKSLEKKVMTEGAGKVPVARKSGLSEAQQRLAQTGSTKDAESAIREYFKNIGFIKESE